MRLTSLPRLLAGLTAGVALALTATVLAQDVSYNAMPGTSFAKFKTYKWVAIKGATAPDQITDTMIKNAIDAELTKKGLAKTESDDADLYVGYQAAVDHSTEWTSFNSGWGYGFGGGMTTMSQDTIATGRSTSTCTTVPPKNWCGGAGRRRRWIPRHRRRSARTTSPRRWRRC